MYTHFVADLVGLHFDAGKLLVITVPRTPIGTTLKSWSKSRKYCSKVAYLGGSVMISCTVDDALPA